MAPSTLIGSASPSSAGWRDSASSTRADVLRVEVVDLELVGDLQQPRHARVDGVVPVAEAGRRNAIALHELLDEIGGGRVDQHARAGQIEALLEQVPAQADVAAVVRGRSPAGRPPRRWSGRRPVLAVWRAASVGGGVTP